MKYLIKNFKVAIAAILIALIAPVLAQLPSDAIDPNREAVNESINKTIINPMDPGYVWGNPLAVDLTNLNPDIFENAAFKKNPGGLMSDMYTTSINDFRNADPKAGVSNATRKAAVVGLIHRLSNSSP
ncbi:MAG: hypothetical protein JW999_05535 [Methanotrichaceae archaeon]|nr:hypothetical protein [Methanotrichaceae archaeon]